MALSLSVLASCSKLEKFPSDFIYEADVKFQVCGKWKIVDHERLLVEHVEDLPLSVCDGMFGFSSADMPKVLNWSRAAIDKIKNNCGK